MAFVWVALAMGLLIALVSLYREKGGEILLAFGGLVTGLGAILGYRAVGQDKHVIKTQLQNGSRD